MPTCWRSSFPDFREDAPLERHLVEQRFWMMDDRSHAGLHYRSDDFNEERPNRYTIIRAQFDKWFSKKVQEAGAVVLCETTVTELLQDADGKVIGVRTDRGAAQVVRRCRRAGGRRQRAARHASRPARDAEARAMSRSR